MSPPRLAGIAVALVGILTSLLPAVSAFGAEQLVNCGGGVRAAVVGCSKAKAIAKEYVRTHDHSLWLYTCTSGANRGRCVLNRKIVTFPLG